MAKSKIWRYTVTPQEFRFWKMEGMQGWRQALEACVEDEAREQGSEKYVVFDRNNEVLAKGEVRKIVEPVLATS
nr:hypothetical protein [uncultured bacterium]